MPVLEPVPAQALHSEAPMPTRPATAEALSRREAIVRGMAARLPDDAWHRSGRNPRLGTIRLHQIVCLWRFHDLGHLRQVADVLRCVSCWPGMGPLRTGRRIDRAGGCTTGLRSSSGTSDETCAAHPSKRRLPACRFQLPTR